jgi:hypothetical protein
MDMQPVVSFAWFAAGVAVLLAGLASAIWTMWRLTTAANPLPMHRRVAIACMLLVIGGALIAHSRIRTWPGQWWTLAPTEVLVQASAVEGARTALGPRLWDPSGHGTWRADALTERQWRVLADQRRRVALDGERREEERSAAAIDLAAFFPSPTVVDPILAELITSQDCRTRRIGIFGAMMYSDQRRAIAPAWLPHLAAIACDARCPESAPQSAYLLAQTTPLPLEHLHQVITGIKGRRDLEGVWRGLGRGLGVKRDAAAEERLAFLAELQASNDPDVRDGLAIMRPIVEAAARIPARLRLPANSNG